MEKARCAFHGLKRFHGFSKNVSHISYKMGDGCPILISYSIPVFAREIPLLMVKLACLLFKSPLLLLKHHLGWWNTNFGYRSTVSRGLNPSRRHAKCLGIVTRVTQHARRRRGAGGPEAIGTMISKDWHQKYQFNIIDLHSYIYVHVHRDRYTYIQYIYIYIVIYNYIYRYVWNALLFAYGGGMIQIMVFTGWIWSPYIQLLWMFVVFWTYHIFRHRPRQVKLTYQGVRKRNEVKLAEDSWGLGTVKPSSPITPQDQRLV